MNKCTLLGTSLYALWHKNYWFFIVDDNGINKADGLTVDPAGRFLMHTVGPIFDPAERSEDRLSSRLSDKRGLL